MQLFRKYLSRMYSNSGSGVLFLETVMELKKQRHTYLDCIPLPKQLANQAKAYFKV
jgi:hypothetical protein